MTNPICEDCKELIKPKDLVRYKEAGLTTGVNLHDSCFEKRGVEKRWSKSAEDFHRIQYAEARKLHANSVRNDGKLEPMEEF
jgi:hypothetical protein